MWIFRQFLWLFLENIKLNTSKVVTKYLRTAEYLFVMLAKMMSFSQLPAVKKTSFWRA